MKLRQAKKIMKNVRLYRGMLWVYGTGRVDKANNRVCRYYSEKDDNFKRVLLLSRTNPLAVLIALSSRHKATSVALRGRINHALV